MRLAWPLILANSAAPLVGLVDTAVIGRLPGAHNLAGVALAAAITSLMLWLFGFLRMATGGLTAQAHGAGDMGEVKRHLLRAGFLAVAIGVVVAATKPYAIDAASAFFEASPAVDDAMRRYLEVRLWGAPFMLALFVLIGWFLGRQNTKAPLAITLAQNVLNVVLNLVLVFGFGFGIEGVAWASVAADLFGCLIGATLAWRAWPALASGPLRVADLAAPAMMTRYLVLARDLVLRTIMMQAAFLSFAKFGVRLGETTLAANAVLYNFFILQAHGLDGFADAAEAMCGKAFGRKRKDELAAAIRAAFQNAVLLSMGVSLLFFLGAPALIDLLTTDEGVRAEAKRYVPWIALMPILSVAAFVYDGIYFGLTRPDVLRNMLIGALALYFAAAFTLPSLWGNHGLWIAFLTFMVGRGVFAHLAFRCADYGMAYLAAHGSAAAKATSPPVE